MYSSHNDATSYSITCMWYSVIKADKIASDTARNVVQIYKYCWHVFYTRISFLQMETKSQKLDPAKILKLSI